MFRFTVLIICALINNICTNVSDNYIGDNTIRLYEGTMAIGKANIDYDRVTIQLYYESLCPQCRQFDTTQLKPLVQELGPYLDVHLYPYGNAKTINHGGSYVFVCQHGPEECYGNKLHACAIDVLKNTTLAVFFNSCLMDYSQIGHGSNDAAADVCGASMFVDSASIKQCARSARGSELLKYYGDESKKAGFRFVPYILINGVPNDGANFKRDVCKAFRNPPPQCRQYK